MLFIAAGGVACAITASFISSQVAMGFGRILRAEIFAHVTGFSLHSLNQISTPSLITRNTNDITQIQNVVMIVLRMMIMADHVHRRSDHGAHQG